VPHRLLTLTAILSAFTSGLFADERPNIVFFFADDQTTCTPGCYGNEVVQTPNIDSLARRGTRFENAFVSHSICWVSRTTILTGLVGRSYGTPSNPELARPDAVEKLYSDILRDHGYRTGYFGKWHAKMPKGYRKEDHFDEFEAIGRNPFYKKQPDGSLRHQTEVIFDRGIGFVKNQPKDKPFALNLWFNACHAEDGDRRPGIGHFPWPRAADGMYNDRQIAAPMLNERFKYVRYFDHGNREFLHDLQTDPDELVNLADDPQYADTLKAIRERTTQRVAEYGGPLDPPKGTFTASTAPHPEASAAVTVKPGQDGFVRLFNGRNLSGWAGDSKYWSVQDSAITGVTDGTPKMNRFLTWKGSTIRNFDLRVKVRISEGGNSGIQYRGTLRPDLGLDVVTGYQCDVVANKAQYNGMVYEEKGRRILSHTGEKVIVDSEGQPWVVGQFPVKEFAPNAWHEYRVLVRGNHHQHWIGGHPTADLIDFDEAGRALEGVLAMQVHVGPKMKVQYKDFRIKHLPDDLPLEQSEDNPIPADAYGVRPQGRLPKDWKAPIYGDR
jgi:hypothetical protein